MTVPPQVIETPVLKEVEVERLKRLYRLAQTESPDPSTKNAAALYFHRDEAVWVSDTARGVNTFPKPDLAHPTRLERPLKYKWVEHAERSVIYRAASQGVRTAGGIMYACWAACPDCARAIVMAGIHTLVTHKHPGMDARPDWAPEVETGDQILLAGGVQVIRYTGTLGQQILFRGELIEV